MPAQVLLAAKAVPYLKRGYWLISKYRTLPAEQRSAVQSEARETIAALAAVKVALTAAHGETTIPKNWEEAQQLALAPDAASLMAREVIAALQEHAEMTTDQLSDAVGAVSRDDTSFKRALDIAKDDGYIRRAGVNFRGIKWDVTEWADRDLLDTPHVRSLEQRIVELIDRFGLCSQDHISAALGLDDDAPELRAALERALAVDNVSWYGHGIYGLASESLRTFVPTEDIWSETAPTDDGEVGTDAALDRLKTSVKSLAKALSQPDDEPADGGPPSIESSIGTADRTGDPVSRLKQLKELADAGVITEAEFEAKKSSLLEAI
jgi:hypothetical protein